MFEIDLWLTVNGSESFFWFAMVSVGNSLQDQLSKVVESFGANLGQFFQLIFEDLDVEVVQVGRDEDGIGSNEDVILKHDSDLEQVFLGRRFFAEFKLKKLREKLEAIQLDQHQHFVDCCHEFVEIFRLNQVYARENDFNTADCVWTCKMFKKLHHCAKLFLQKQSRMNIRNEFLDINDLCCINGCDVLRCKLNTSDDIVKHLLSKSWGLNFGEFWSIFVQVLLDQPFQILQS